MLQGVDTSTHQSAVDERKMRAAGVDFRLIKLSEGGDFVDKLDGSGSDSNLVKSRRLAAQVAAIRANGMHAGGYHYLRARKDRTGAQEIDFAISIETMVNLAKPGDLRLAIDIENRLDMEAMERRVPEAPSVTRLRISNQGAANTRAYLISAVKRYRARRGHYPMIYTFPSYWADLIRGASAADKALLAQCPLWIAHFGAASPTIPTPFTQSAIWQKTEKAIIGGEGPVDFNVADERRFRTALVPSVTPTPVDPVEPVRDVDVKELQRSLNRFERRWMCDRAPLIVDGVRGPATNRRIMAVKFYLGYGKDRNAAVTSEFVRRMRHPRMLRYSTPKLIATGIARRRRMRKACATQKSIPGFEGAVLYDGKPVPAWTVEWLDKARNYNGPGGPWRGGVNSGIRTPQRSVEICRSICGRDTCSCCPACAGLGSNHNATPPVVHCEGALDLSDFIRFGQIMRALGAPLRNALPNDLIHFSCSGR